MSLTLALTLSLSLSLTLTLPPSGIRRITRLCPREGTRIDAGRGIQIPISTSTGNPVALALNTSMFISTSMITTMTIPGDQGAP